MEIKSCAFCKHMEHHEGSSCATCGYDPYDACSISEKTKVYTIQGSQKDLCVIAMKCPFFELHPEIQELINKNTKQGVNP
jgi:hypothetical protein